VFRQRTNELLAEERVLDEEFSAGAHEIGEEPAYRTGGLAWSRHVDCAKKQTKSDGQAAPQPHHSPAVGADQHVPSCARSRPSKQA
jgi:hypothetical protein